MKRLASMNVVTFISSLKIFMRILLLFMMLVYVIFLRCIRPISRVFFFFFLHGSVIKMRWHLWWCLVYVVTSWSPLGYPTTKGVRMGMVGWIRWTGYNVQCHQLSALPALYPGGSGVRNPPPTHTHGRFGVPLSLR